MTFIMTALLFKLFKTIVCGLTLFFVANELHILSESLHIVKKLWNHVIYLCAHSPRSTVHLHIYYMKYTMYEYNCVRI